MSTDIITEFTNVHFSYDTSPVFSDLSIQIPAGVTSLVGQNGTGKTTFLLLAGGRLFPSAGTVQTLGTNTACFTKAHEDPAQEEARNRLVSFVFQNMEFETEAPIGELLEYVYHNGFRSNTPAELLATVIEELELAHDLTRRTQELSKGALQRVIIAFSLLYGSPVVMMDEPVFALEDNRKERVMQFLTDFAQSDNISLLYSAHELHLTEKFSDNVLLFQKDGGIELGSTTEMMTRDKLEAAYQVPLDMLYRKEQLYREALKQPGSQ